MARCGLVPVAVGSWFGSTRFAQLNGLLARLPGACALLEEPNQEPKCYRRAVGVSGPRRGHGEDSIYFDSANNCYVGAVSLGHKAGKRVRRKVTGRTKTEVKAKLRQLPLLDQPEVVS